MPHAPAALGKTQGSISFTRASSALSIIAPAVSLRLRERDFDVRMWRANAWRRATFPEAVFLNLLDAPLCVFSFGMTRLFLGSPREGGRKACCEFTSIARVGADGRLVWRGAGRAP